jgi:hypothetical protein
MTFRSLWNGPARLAVIALAVVSLLVATVIVRAQAADKFSPAETSRASILGQVQPHPADTSSDDLLDAAIDRDPFSPTREAPDSRYGVAVAAPVTIPSISPAEAPSTLHLVGTVVDEGGDSFVLCQIGPSPARILRVGQKIGTFELRSITQGGATFVTNTGDRLELRIPRAGT